jgi:hypothetical protein
MKGVIIGRVIMGTAAGIMGTGIMGTTIVYYETCAISVKYFCELCTS